MPYIQKPLNLLRQLLPYRYKQGIKRLLGLPSARLHDDWKLLEMLGKQDDSHIIFDLGAHNGWFTHCWLDWCPLAEVHAFEPYHPAYKKLSLKFNQNDNVTINNFGVGDSEEQSNLNVLESSKISNSFLTPDQQTWDEISYVTGEVNETKVNLTCLDSYVTAKNIERIFLIKIDVQGYELKVLNGAEKILDRVDHIFVESALRPLYQDAPLFTEVYEKLYQCGFHLISMQAWHRGNHMLVETDMLFRRNDLATGISEEFDRKYVRF